MRGCACGYTCGTPAALQRHLERQVTPACVEVDPAALTTAVDEGIARAIRTVYDDDDILKFIGKDGVADAWLAKNAAKMREGVTKDEVLKMMIGRATRDGHAPVASQLLRFIRSLHRKEGDALSGANVVSSVLNWAAMGSCGAHGPALIAMLVVDGHLDELRQGPLDRWQRMSVLLGKPGAAEDEGTYTATGLRAIGSAQRHAGRPDDASSSADDRSARRRSRRPAAAHFEAARLLVAEQVSLIAENRLDWSAAGHRDFPLRFRAVVRTLLLCARRPDCVVAKLPADALLHIVSVLARVWFWECR